LASLEPVRGAAQLVHHHQERWDGHGYPDRLAGDAIPWGARLLKLAVDFIELQMGMILSRPLSEEETLENMTLNRGAIYDPTLFDEFVVFLSADQSGCEPADDPTTEVTSILLMPGMIIAKNL